ncbi:MAG: hypothetical protein EPN65_16690 [Pandoraea sp.]|uniref:hypothetical protein n=1 Tax=Pandoraea sp. TaxID=1883445 RepID=UPI0011FECBD2|nr:hypothetical protein [Pandoraea sp.]TAM15951.1 MAG: hypothetical protein EPN65_16690 [Pandoraea sp.]
MTPRTLPVELDRHALSVARNIATVDRNRLPGAEEQFIAILHEAIVASMWVAIERHVRDDVPPLPAAGRVREGGAKSRPLDAQSHAQQRTEAAGVGRSEETPC